MGAISTQIVNGNEKIYMNIHVKILLTQFNSFLGRIQYPVNRFLIVQMHCTNLHQVLHFQVFLNISIHR